MKNFATGATLDMTGIAGGERQEPTPLLGFMTGILLSAALWLDIALAAWIVSP